MTRYRCGAHLRPVDWRSHGCPLCDAEQRERDEIRAAEKAARRRREIERREEHRGPQF
ncbi:MAG: hypothetical protein QM286_14415 [Acidobacteriota bacterium]|nr:hypothetical protein [Acidobacteriota bacterium]